MKSFIRNLVFLGGLTSLGVGLWWCAPWLALTVLGALLVGLGLLGHLAGGE